MAWDQDSFKAGFAAGRALWNSHIKYMRPHAQSQQPQIIQNEEEGEEDE